MRARRSHPSSLNAISKYISELSLSNAKSAGNHFGAGIFSIHGTISRKLPPMFAKPTCAAVIPCFNEAETIAPLVLTVRQFVDTVLVVDDGSTDDTAILAGDAGATVVHHARNSGKGAALKTGLVLAQQLGFEWAATLDGDGQHAPEDLPGLLCRAETTVARLVVGNRMVEARKMPWLRRRVNRWMSRKLSQRARRLLPDTQCGFRLIHLPSWAELKLSTKRFEVESEMLMAFLTAGHVVEFAPIQVIRSRRVSRIRPVADSLRWLRWWKNAGQFLKSREPLDLTVHKTLPVGVRI